MDFSMIACAGFPIQEFVVEGLIGCWYWDYRLHCKSGRCYLANKLSGYFDHSRPP